MDEGQGSQYAVQIAVSTLRDRCRHLQQRVALLEEENVNLRIQCSRQDEAKTSLNELDYLRAQVAELSQQKEQFQNKVKMITNENQELWNKLSKLSRVNKSLGSQLTKINDTLTQHTTTQNNPTAHHTNLIRSKTFTKTELQTKVLQKNLEENDKISLELEDISLKLSDSFSKQKKELDILCSEISEMTLNDEVITEDCGFILDEDLENDIFIEVESFGEDLRLLKEAVLQQQTVLVQNLKNMEQFKEKRHCKTCQSKKPKEDKTTSTSDLTIKTFDDKCTETDLERSSNQESPTKKETTYTEYHRNDEKICPLCSKVFHKHVDFQIFQQHVEGHFVPDVDSYEML